ncbi:MAG: sigma-70 family RNA polymerase sigma factor [Sphingomonas sp.]|nr:sigma-70 family RNA polymerase sigma factor [Sphingomonas sp.]
MRLPESPPPLGPTRGLGDFARRFAGPLRRFFARRLGNEADVADLVQDVFERLSRLDDPGGVQRAESFVFVTAANVLKDHARRARVRGAGLHDPIDAAADRLAGSQIPPDRVLASGLIAAQVRAALLELPERTRDVIVLRLMEGWKMADIATALGISTRAAEKHQARGLAHLVERLRGWR